MHLILICQIALLAGGLGVVAGAVALHSHAAVAAGHFLLFLVGAAHLGRAVTRRAQGWSLCDIHAASLLISYFGGSSVTLSLSRTGFIEGLALPELATILEASVYVAFVAVCLYCFGRIEAPFWRRLFRQDLHAGWPGWLPVAMLALGAAAASQLASGAVSLQGVVNIDATRVPVHTAFIVAFSWPMAGVCGWILGSATLRRRPLFLASALALIPVELALNFAYGRRVILFQALIFLTCFVWSRGRGFTLRQLAVLGAVAAPLIYGLWVVFLALRLEGYQHASSLGTRDIFTRLESAAELMDRRWDRVAERQEEEVVDRVFVLGYVVDLMENARLMNRFEGRALVNEIMTAVPRVLLPDKDRLLRSLNANEAAIGQRYNIGTKDRPSSLVTVAWVDFRWLGPVLYSMLAMMVGIAMATMAGAVNLNFFSVYAICFVFLKALGTEAVFFTDKLEMLRATAVLFALLCLYRLLRRVVAEPYMVRRHVWR